MNNPFSEEEIRYNRRVHDWIYKLDNGEVYPVRELMNMEDKIQDLEARLKALSDALAEKDRQIIDLEAAKESMTKSWQNELRLNCKMHKELSEYKRECAKQEADIRCKDETIVQLLNQREKHTV